MTVKIYHNPRCSKCRDTLTLLKSRGIEPEVIEYLKNPLTAEDLQEIITKLAIHPRELMRTKEAEYKDNILDDIELTEAQLIDAMVKMPKLIERPIVVVNDKAVIGRPPENVLAIIE